MKTRGNFVATLLGVVVSIVMTSSAALAADVANGKALALKWCSACHLVANDQERVSDAPLPSFYDVAKDPSLSSEALKTFLADPHPKMPNMSLSNSEISDLAGYIGSLAP
ncbi:c-type cytochrome [Roseibium sp.]|uniref:c-type cytochrome n=1 Tax=Roseibium sp. TaxID=1936156 RepID=UPI003A9725AF